MNNFRCFLVCLFSIFVSVSLLGASNSNKFILNSYYNPNRLVFRLNRNSFECSLFGVVIPYYGDSNCDSKNFKIMSNLAIGFMQNNLNLEQLYNVDFVNGYCVVSYSNINFNEKIIMDGYGVVNQGSVVDIDMRSRFLYLQDIAMNNKTGLWNSFYDEMICIKNAYL